MKWLKRLWDWIRGKQPDPDPQPNTDLPANIEWHGNAYAATFAAFPVHDVTARRIGHDIELAGDALKLGEAFEIGAEISLIWERFGVVRGDVIEGFRASDCRDGFARREVLGGWIKDSESPHVHEDDHTPPEHGWTYDEIQAHTDCRVLGVVPSSVVKRRNGMKQWRGKLQSLEGE
jgi:hypothetical protein